MPGRQQQLDNYGSLCHTKWECKSCGQNIQPTCKQFW